MAAIEFPDIAGTLGPLIQMKRAEEQNAFTRDRMRMADEKDAREREAEQYIPAAMTGDKEALGNLAAKNFRAYAAIIPHLDRLTTQQRQTVKDATEASTRVAMSVLSARPEDKVAAYDSGMKELHALGYGDHLKDMPAQYTPGVEGLLRSKVDRMRPYVDYYKDQNTQLGVWNGAGGAAGPAVGTPPPNRDAFVAQMMPHAMAVSQQTGLDPRLVVAQAALESGWGQSAPGNNYFGIKSHGQAGGQMLATTEAGPGGALVPTQDSFRTYQNPGESAQDYAKFLQTNGRYGPMLAAKDLPSQIDALGKSGYATDPAYADKIRQIAFSLPTPGAPQANGPPVQLAGGPAAPMPQGGDQPTGNQPGVMPGPLPNMQTIDQLNQHPGARSLQSLLPPGYAIAKTRAGEIHLKDGVLAIAPVDAQGRQSGPVEHWQIPKQKEPKDAPNAGTDAGDVAILQSAFKDPSVVQSPEWQAAYARAAQPKQAQGGQLMYPNMGVYDKFLNGTPAPQTDARLQDTPQSRFQMSGKLADDFNQLKPVKAYREVVPIFQSMQDALNRPTPVSDLNLVYGLAKIMDPESVVREGEQVMVRNAQSLPDWLRGMISKAQGGSGFVPEQRARIIQEAESRVGALKGQFDSIAGQFSDRAKRFGLNPEDVLTVPSNQPAEEKKGAQSGTYLSPDNRPINRNEIEETAKNRGMTPDEVIRRLNLKPADAK